MADLQIRDIPDSIRQSLESEATLRGQTLQEYLVFVLEQEAHRVANRALLREFTVANPRPAVPQGRYLTAVDGAVPDQGGAVLEAEEPDED
jgi:hypothetical protein